MAEAIASGHISGDGPFTKRCQALLEAALGVPKVLLTTSCTHALEMAALLLDLRAGDEVDRAVVHVRVDGQRLRPARRAAGVLRRPARHAEPRRGAARARGSRRAPRRSSSCTTRASAARWTRSWRTAGQHGICRRRGQRARPVRPVPAAVRSAPSAALATQSFHETKNFTCGEGGALLINDPRYVERAEIMREKGTNRSRFFRGQVDKYTWVDLGSSYLPSRHPRGVPAGAARGARRDPAQAPRGSGRRYRARARRLGARARACGCRSCPTDCEQAYHMFYLLLPSLAARAGADRAPQGSAASWPSSTTCRCTSPTMGRRFGGKRGRLPGDRGRQRRGSLRLPFYNELTEADQAEVIETVRAVRD